jgi:hypothetical protein
MEKDELINRWHTLELEMPEPAGSNPDLSRSLLEERLAILHRLNELGAAQIDSHTIVEALEQTNFGLRQINKEAVAKA